MFIQKTRVSASLLFTMALICCGSFAFAESLWDLQAVDANGVGTHPKALGEPIESNKVTVEGIALNAPAELLNPSTAWQIYVQAEGDDTGGIAVWAGKWYQQANWPKYSTDIQAGDRVHVRGYLMPNARGKVNINERHSADPAMQLEVTVLERGVGMPDLQVIPSLAHCNFFDMHRAGGGERYQAQWVELRGVTLQSGNWVAGQTVVITDASGATLDMLLSSEGEFTDPAPTQTFTVRGIFDQEDLTSPFWENYRLWVKSDADVIADVPSSSVATGWELYE